ncbi:MAG: hypothetical protein U0V73_04930 [Acidimicrobiia bacterium]
MKLDVSTVLVQWSTGGLFFGWITTRHRIVGLGYGWLLRSVYGGLALIAILAGAAGVSGWLLAGALGVVAGAAGALLLSVIRRDLNRFPPAVDLVAPVIGLVGLVGAAAAVGGPYPLALARLVVGAAFLGVLTDAMLLGHWYLVQPGLGREPVKELVRDAAIVWPFEVAVFLWPVGMLQVFTGTVSDGYQGLLGWVWVACAVTTIVLVYVTWRALQEPYYSAVMAATGLLYLAILTGFGTDLVARAVLS